MVFVRETKETRERASREMALCLLVHLREELKKSPELLSNVTAEGITFEQHTLGIISELEDLFPGIGDEAPWQTEQYSANIMRDWWENAARTSGRDAYEDSTFKFMNALTLDRIRYAADPSEEARENLLESAVENMIRTRLVERGLAFVHLLYVLSFMRRLEERRFEALGFAPTEAYRALSDRVENAQNAALFKYYYDLAESALQKSDRLLRNILPDSVADKLRENETPLPVHHESATVVFTDFVGFSRNAFRMEPSVLVEKLDRHFSAYDDIIDSFGLEKLKTIGDSYMFAGGIPEECSDHAIRCVRAALEIRDYARSQFKTEENPWSIRIGVHSGPIVSGIVGHKKFSYDIWGDTVNVASRMESTGETNEVNISEDTYRLLEGVVKAHDIGLRSIKNRGKMRMFTVDGIL